MYLLESLPTVIGTAAIAPALLVLWLVSFAIFSLVRILPGDAVLMQLDQAASPTPEMLARARQELGLDRPFLEQYRTWMAGVVRGDLGHSLTSRRPVTQELLKRVSLTSHLAVMSMIIALLIALPIGVLALLGITNFLLVDIRRLQSRRKEKAGRNARPAFLCQRQFGVQRPAGAEKPPE